jgi:hypothetical protein
MRAFSGSLAEMFFHRHPAGRLSPEEAMAERMLAGQSAGPGAPPGHQALEQVLAAAAGPATQRELSGEVAAVAAFLLATRPNGSRARHGRPTRRPMARRPAYKLPAVTAALVMIMVLAIGGTAAAGALPGPLQRLAHTTFGAPAPVEPGQPPVGNPQDGQGTSSPATTASRPAATPGGTESNSPASGAGNAQGQQEPKPASTATSSTTQTGDGQGDGNNQGNGNNQGGGTGHSKGPSLGIRPTPSPPPTPASPTGSVRPGKTDGQG